MEDTSLLEEEAADVLQSALQAPGYADDYKINPQSQKVHRGKTAAARVCSKAESWDLLQNLGAGQGNWRHH